MLCILSPAKKLAEQPAQRCELTTPQLIQSATEMAGIMHGYSPPDLAKLMSISGALAQLNHARFQTWKPTGNQASAAVFSFMGDVYKELDASSLSSAELKRAQQRIRILSGLYGLLRPFDGIYPYRLEMGSKVPSSRGNNLYKFWKESVTTTLHKDLAISNSRILINLASQEYAKAIDMDKLGVTVIAPRFLDTKNGTTRTRQLYVKRARGMMARYLVQAQPQTLADLTAFNQQGYTYTPHRSTPTQPVFIREHAA